MIRVRSPEAIDALIALLPSLEGEVRGDVVRNLEAIAGQPHGTDVQAWQAWWKEHQAGFVLPAEAGTKEAAAAVAPGAIPTTA